MILVDVFVPSIDKEYDFQLNEDVPVSQVIEEVAQMIEQKEHTKVIGDVRELLLCNRANNGIMKPQLSLRENDVKSGDSLILV